MFAGIQCLTIFWKCLCADWKQSEPSEYQYLTLLPVISISPPIEISPGVVVVIVSTWGVSSDNQSKSQDVASFSSRLAAHADGTLFM